jgi:hypothetical protein
MSKNWASRLAKLQFEDQAWAWASGRMSRKSSLAGEGDDFTARQFLESENIPLL